MNDISTKPTRMGVRYVTELCDAAGNVIRELQRGRNMITDWGMDSLATKRQDEMITYLHLGSATSVLKRVAAANSITVNFSGGPGSVVATSTGSFFLVGDVGKTLKIDGYQELKITAYTDAFNVTCQARGSAWLPSFTPTAGPFSAFGVHATDTATMATQFSKYNTLDTSATNNNAELNDSANSRWIHQRIFLSAAVTGSPWTVNQVGWSDGNGSNLCFGIANLAAPDIIAVGFRYRLTLQFYSAYTPLNIASFSANWGVTVGTYDLKIVQECIPKDSQSVTSGTNFPQNFLRPSLTGTNSWYPAFVTSAQTPQALKWDGDVGYSKDIHGGSGAGVPTADSSTSVTDSAYTAGAFNKTRTVKWSDVLNIAAGTMLGIRSGSSGGFQFLNSLGIYPNSGTINKPSGHWISLAFQIFWTRELIN